MKTLGLIFLFLPTMALLVFALDRHNYEHEPTIKTVVTSFICIIYGIYFLLS